MKPLALVMLAACSHPPPAPPQPPPPIAPAPKPTTKVLARYQVGDNTTFDIAIDGVDEHAHRTCQALVDRALRQRLPKELSTRVVRDCRAEELPVIHAAFLLVDTREPDVLEQTMIAGPDLTPMPATIITQSSRYDTEAACRRVERLLADEAAHDRIAAAQATAAFSQDLKQRAEREAKQVCDRAAVTCSPKDSYCEATRADQARRCSELRLQVEMFDRINDQQPPPKPTATCRPG